VPAADEAVRGPDSRDCLRYVDGRLQPAPPRSMRCARRSGTRSGPLYYLAITGEHVPGGHRAPERLEPVRRAAAWWSRSPSGTTSLPRRAPQTAHCTRISRKPASFASTITSARRRCRTSCISASPTLPRAGVEPQLSSPAWQITMAEKIGGRRPVAAFYEETGAVRDVHPEPPPADHGAAHHGAAGQQPRARRCAMRR